jgi:hypothetical protein
MKQGCQHCGRWNHEVKDCWWANDNSGQQNATPQPVVGTVVGKNVVGTSGNGGAVAAAGNSSAVQAFMAFLSSRGSSMTQNGHVATGLGTATPAQSGAEATSSSSSSSGPSTNTPWVLDSGASNHLCNEKDLGSIYYTENARGTLNTCLGEAQITRGAAVDIPTARNVEHALLLPDTPNCASMGRLIEQQKFKIEWEAGSCMWTTPEGVTHRLPVRDFNPVLQYQAT